MKQVVALVLIFKDVTKEMIQFFFSLGSGHGANGIHTFGVGYFLHHVPLGQRVGPIDVKRKAALMDQMSKGDGCKHHFAACINNTITNGVGNNQLVNLCNIGSFELSY